MANLQDEQNADDPERRTDENQQPGVNERDGAGHHEPLGWVDADPRTASYSAEPYDGSFDDDEEEERPGVEMGFFEHLEELRWRIVKSLIALGVGAGISAYFLKFIMQDIILGPANRLKLQLRNFEVMGQMTLAIQVALISGLIIAIPFVLWQFWGFVKPGLFPKERKYASVIAIATIFCFLIGICFSYFVMIPTSLSFTSQFIFEGIENTFSVSSYFSFVLGFTLACGGIFEMPMLSYALSRFGIITPALLRSYRRHGAVIILIIAAIITPTPDPFNQLILAVPLYVLFEISIFVSTLAGRQRDQAMTEFEEEGASDAR